MFMPGRRGWNMKKSRLLATALPIALVGLLVGIAQSAHGRPLFHVVGLGSEYRIPSFGIYLKIDRSEGDE
jgi:hypothetical protein